MSAASPSRFVIRSGDIFFKYRNAIFPAVFAVVALLSPPAIFLNDPRLDLWVTGLGALLVVLGQGFRLAVIGYAYIKRGGKDGKVFADNLVIAGFFAHTRNPMYVGNLSIVIGLAVMYGSLGAYFFAIPFFIFAYLCITATEENYLKGKFGAEYEAYTHRVNRFVPDFRNLDESLKQFRYNWKRALRKDYGNVFQALMGMTLIAGWKSYLSNTHRISAVGLTAAIVAAAFYLGARVLKKTGALAS